MEKGVLTGGHAMPQSILSSLEAGLSLLSNFVTGFLYDPYKAVRFQTPKFQRRHLRVSGLNCSSRVFTASLSTSGLASGFQGCKVVGLGFLRFMLRMLQDVGFRV